MKVRVDVNATPEELRRFFGMPDLRPLNDDMVEMIRQRMHEGVEGYDPFSLLSPLTQSSPAFETLQRLFWSGMPGSGGSDRSSDDRSPEE